jgi:hypothetical protein
LDIVAFDVGGAFPAEAEVDALAALFLVEGEDVETGHVEVRVNEFRFAYRGRGEESLQGINLQ